MNKIILIASLILLGQSSFSQMIPTYTKPKATKPKSIAPKPAVVKTKIIYVDRPVSSATTEETNTKSFEPQMVFVPGGSFTIGSNESGDEKPIHSVSVNSFRMSKFEVTFAQYRFYCNATGTAMPEAPSWGLKDTYPIVNVSYEDATRYCNWLGSKTGKAYRLPTEAEWEFAARGGNNSSVYTYSGSNDIEEVAWYNGNSDGQAQACGGKRPNELGLYDMSGNVWEWCKDWYDRNYYSNSPSGNPRGPSSGAYRVSRGGSWINFAGNSRVANRDYITPDYRHASIGFRLVCP